jgi:endonuclease/exonuclease/phosphatase family metal-dependent hydrolase
MASLRVATWNIAGARREQTNQVDLDAVVAGVRALGVDLLAVQEVDRTLARSGRSDQPTVIAQALGAGWLWSFAPALVGDDFRPLSGPDPGGPAYGNLLVSRLPLAAVEHLRFPRPAAVNSAPRSWPPSRWGRARSRWRPPLYPPAKATTSASCGSCSRWPDPGRRRGCWWAT